MATPPLRGRASEREALDRLIAGAREGRSGVLVIRGTAGVGKTALMRYAAGQATAFRVVEIAGVESERELPFAGLQQFCRPLLDRLDALAQPQRDALDVAFGLASGAAPDRFLVGLATLTLAGRVRRGAAGAVRWSTIFSGWTRPPRRCSGSWRAGCTPSRWRSCSASAARATRAGLPELRLEGLEPQDAAALLSTVVAGRLDERVRDRLIAETGGNPLALLELPRGMSAAELAGGFALPGPLAPTGIEDAVRQRRIDPLPADTRRLLQLAAADPVGEPLLVWRAAERLGIDPDAAAAAVDAGVLDLGAQVRFNHPCMRSATYRSATSGRTPRAARRARGRHRLAARSGPARVAPRAGDARTGRAGGRGARALGRTRARPRRGGGRRRVPRERGHADARPARRAGRLLAAAQAKRNAGALDAALRLLAAVERRRRGARSSGCGARSRSISAASSRPRSS